MIQNSIYGHYCDVAVEAVGAKASHPQQMNDCCGRESVPSTTSSDHDDMMTVGAIASLPQYGDMMAVGAIASHPQHDMK